MKKITNCSIRDTMNIYQFMRLCGLSCEPKRKKQDGKLKMQLLSHEGMIKKLSLRAKDYSNVIVPNSLSFDNVIYEKVKRGQILLVRDDYGKILPYNRPVAIETVTFSDEEREEIRSKLIDEYLENSEEEDSLLKPGEIKYMNRMKKRGQEKIKN